MEKFRTTCFINIYGVVLKKLESIERYFNIVPRIGESVELFDDGSTLIVEDVEHNFDGSTTLVFKASETEYDYYEELVELEPTNKFN